MTTIPPTPSPPPPPVGYGYAYTKPGHTMAIAAVTLGAIGAVIGLGPFIFGVFAAAFGLAAIALGVFAYRAARKVGAHRGRAGILLGAIALTLGIIGMVTVENAVNDLQDDLEQIGPTDTEDYVPPTQAELDAASIDELYRLYGEAPVGSDAEAQIEAELTQRGEFG
jgi:hypothetical protein